MNNIFLIHKLFPKKKIIPLYFFPFCNIFLSFMEIFGISLLIPLINIILGNGDFQFFKKFRIDHYIENNSFLSSFTSNTENLFILIILMIIFLIIIKNSFNILLKYKLKIFLNSSNYYLSNYVIKKTLNYNLLDFYNLNSSQYINRVTNVNLIIETKEMIINLFYELIYIIVAIIFLLFLNFKITLYFILFSFLACICYFYVFKKQISNKGYQSFQLREKIIKELKYFYNSFIIIKLSNNLDLFVEKSKQFIFDKLKKELSISIISNFTKFYFDFLVCLALIFLIIFSSNNSIQDLKDNLPIISIFVLISVRLLPILIKISKYTTILKSREKILEEFDIFLNSNTSDDSKDNQIQNINKENFLFDLRRGVSLENVSFDYLNQNYKNNKILDKINTKFDFGKITGIKGETGSGKTTLIKILCGLIKPINGKILIHDQDINFDITKYQENISLVEQNIYLLDNTIEENIKFGNIKFNDIVKILKEVDLYDFVQGLDKKEQTFIGENGAQISGGQRQKIGIARAIFDNKKILIFDESFNSINLSSSIKIIENLKKFYSDTIIIIISHDQEILNLCDTVKELKKTQLK